MVSNVRCSPTELHRARFRIFSSPPPNDPKGSGINPHTESETLIADFKKKNHHKDDYRRNSKRKSLDTVNCYQSLSKYRVFR